MWEILQKELFIKQINNNYDSTSLIKQIYKNIKNNYWEEELYYYFSEIYNELFINLIIKKTFVSYETKKMLELLASPIYKKDELEKRKIYAEIEKQ